MKRIVALVSLLLCVALAFGSCSLTAMSFKQLYRKYEYKADHLFTTSSELTALEGLDRVNAMAHLLVFETEDDKTLKFYNAKTDSVALSLTETDSKTYEHQLFHVMNIPFIYVLETIDGDEKDTVYAYIYDDKGTEIAKEKDPEHSSAPAVEADLFKFDDLIWRVNEDGSVEKITENPIASYLPDIDAKTEKFYYSVGSDEVSVYDDELNCVFFWEAPFDELEDLTIYLLSDGVLLAQGLEYLPEDAEKYDYSDDGDKVNVVSYILNAKRNSAKEVDLDYVVYYVASNDELSNYLANEEDDYLPNRLVNFASIYYIDDHRVDSRYTLVTIRDNGSVFEIVPEYDSVPEPVAEDRFLDRRDNGESYLIDGKGKIIANVTGIVDDMEANEKFIAYEGKLYDYDLKLVYDAEEKDEEIVEMLATSVILSKEVNEETKYYLYKADGTTTEITDYDKTFAGGYVTLKDGTYTLYNEAGTKLAESKSMFTPIYSSTDGEVRIIKGTDDDGNKYFKLT